MFGRKGCLVSDSRVVATGRYTPFGQQGLLRLATLCVRPRGCAREPVVCLQGGQAEREVMAMELEAGRLGGGKQRACSSSTPSPSWSRRSSSSPASSRARSACVNATATGADAGQVARTVPAPETRHSQHREHQPSSPAGAGDTALAVPADSLRLPMGRCCNTLSSSLPVASRAAVVSSCSGECGPAGTWCSPSSCSWRYPW